MASRRVAKICEVCGAKFSKRPDETLWYFQRRRTCSTQCRRRLVAQILRRTTPPKECPECGTLFSPRPDEPPSKFKRRQTCSGICGRRVLARRLAHPLPPGWTKQHRGIVQRYGLSPWQWLGLWETQCGRCAICDGRLDRHPSPRTHVDHDHVTGRVRALLCKPCNLGVGQLERLTPRAIACRKYIEAHRVFS